MTPAARRPFALAGVAAAFALALAGCGGDEEPPGAPGAAAGGSERPLVVVTTSILGDVVRNIVADDATVEVLVPPGVDPHDFAPSARQAQRVREADVVVANGHGFEESFSDVLESAEADGVDVYAVAKDVETIPVETGGFDEEHAEDEAEAEDDHGAGSPDPHFFTDPVRTAEAAELIGDHLAERAPAAFGTAAVRERAAAYAAELRRTADEVEEILAAVAPEDRLLVTNHDVFGYFAERFGFEVVGTIIPGGTTLAEPSAADLDELVTAIERSGVPAVFAETSAPDRLAQALAAEAGLDVEVVELYAESLGEAGSGADTYVGMVTTNAERIAGALAP